MNPRNLKTSNRHRHEFQMMRKVGGSGGGGGVSRRFVALGYCVARMAVGTGAWLIGQKLFDGGETCTHGKSLPTLDCAGLKSVQFISLDCYFVRIYLLREGSCMICTE